ncbi:trypsin-like peptidase domain-containing protein [Catalinimonas niigatensis]|uniref:trypsin-like peptidase domain-containing protein n=1 Tax=Catalinimonas niigatensis TaxID=1397264 RepID=UPI0026668674|nr:trypsin-like peptidase domain-containing protein [Catalinimonas niigatensis]WPP50516.1 trypsin-like peptidase domain-containing protein [Catalinimonas niigatensis]
MKNVIIVVFVGFFSGISGAFTYHQLFFPEKTINQPIEFPIEPKKKASDVKMAFNTLNDASEAPVSANLIGEDFAEASSKSTPSVVYVKTISESEYNGSSWMELFFEGRTNQQVSSGSGVIYTQDGFIITNNHVIDNATLIEVIHNKRTYSAEVVGTDPSTDLAVLKITGENMPAISLGNSRNLRVGEWVLAVGNPFNLNSTVTAGIVSAKGREINILQSKFPIESFIQTDAAINPGNSGGALVDRNGDLVGINTAILSRTGSYAGYGFAVPVDIVRKVVDDIIEYGEVQKAFFGADVVDVNGEIAEQLNTNELNGVVLSYLQRNGAAEKAGLQKGDIILKIENEPVHSRSDFEELISYRSPGDNINVVYKRKNKLNSVNLELTNREGTVSLTTRAIYASEKLGAEMESISKVEADIMDIEGGVKINKVKNGLIRRLGIEEGFVVTAINKYPVNTPQECEEILTKIRGRVRIEGVNKKGVRGYYSFHF